MNSPQDSICQKVLHLQKALLLCGYALTKILNLMRWAVEKHPHCKSQKDLCMVKEIKNQVLVNIQSAVCTNFSPSMTINNASSLQIYEQTSVWGLKQKRSLPLLNPMESFFLNSATVPRCPLMISFAFCLSYPLQNGLQKFKNG